MNYSLLVDVYEQLEKTTKKLEKTFIIAEFLKKCPKEDLKSVILLLQGKVFPPWDERKIGMSSKLIIKAIANSSGESTQKIERMLGKIGDLGEIASMLITDKKQKTLFNKRLTIKKVIDNIRKLSELEGEGTVNKKIGLASELLTSAEPREAKFIVRTILEDLRTGVAEGILRDSLVWAYAPKVIGIFYRCEKCNTLNPKIKKCLKCQSLLETKFDKEARKHYKNALRVKSLSDLKNTHKYTFIIPADEAMARKIYNLFVEKVEHAYDVTTDFTVVAEALKERGIEGIENIGLVSGKPIKVMLYQKAKNIEDALKQVGSPAIIEPKFDGFRMQIHKTKEGKIKLFTRRLEDVTSQFPDVVEAVKKNVRANNYILDSEVVGINPKTKKFVPFQNISQRIKRKYHIQRLIKELPVVIEIFDAIEINNENLLNKPFIERRKKLEAVVHQQKGKIELVEQLKSENPKQIDKFYKKALKEGHEGIMIKNIDGVYKPGSRVGYGVKLKPLMETLDLVIVGAEWGEGKRAKWLSSFVLACRDKGNYVEIGKVGTGIKEKSEEGVSFSELTKELKPLIIEENGKSVKLVPKLVVEVDYQEIQKSPTYSSGYALRFPRVVRVRYDREAEDCDTLQRVKKLYESQKKKN